MESKNVRVIDEHSIERSANIICAFDVDGSEYVTYWIERDAENDNIFVSKLLKNIDGTSSMVNIEDTMEKAKISDIVKELIKYAIDNESDKLTNKNVNLPSGKSVLVVSVIINKDQNINVQKTYITTVKKSVTIVSDKYYEVNEGVGVQAPTVEPVAEPVVEAPKVVEPVIETVVPSMPEPVAPVVEPVVAPVTPAAVVPEPVLPVMPEVPEPAKVETPIVQPVVEEPKIVEPVIPQPVAPTEVKVEPTVIPPVPTPVVETPAPSVEPVVVAPVVPEVQPMPEAVVAPVMPTEVKPEPTVVPPVPEPASVTPEENRLVFDASKETNLNEALGEASVDATIPVENIAPVREFGVDEPTTSTTPATPETTTSDAPATPPASGGKMGFANSKFFMVVAIAFFLASCVFLGYEVFNYFQLR